MSTFMNTQTPVKEPGAQRVPSKMVADAFCVIYTKYKA